MTAAKEKNYVCIHGHFYQPPRENPWLQAIEIQESAAPSHDWNEKIHRECYEPNCETRLLSPDGRILEIINNYEWINFNIGPTLLSWMERSDPASYEQIVEADRRSVARCGHGNAIAQCYNHTIMPLTEPRDKQTQVRWGIADFERRFGREPEGMWLPETAVDLESLEVLAAHDIKFTILAPSQAKRFRDTSKAKWVDVQNNGGVDPTRPYICRLPGGKCIALFFYDGPISHDIAFAGLLRDGVKYAQRLRGGFNDKRSWPQLVLVATDGESYGHHQQFGDMALAKAISELRQSPDVEIVNLAAYLERHPPTAEAEIVEPSSWSCAHGVERWRDDCGCNSGGSPAGWNQKWRKSFRQTFDWLRTRLDPLFEKEGARLLRDPWAARDDYIALVLDRSLDNVEAFFERHAARPLEREEEIAALRLLEIQRHGMLMYTSCAWFFDEPSGIEPVQNMKYATRAVQLAAKFGPSLEKELKKRLKAVLSNKPEYGNCANIHERLVAPARVDLRRVVAHSALTLVIEERPREHDSLYCYQLHLKDFFESRRGRHSVSMGRMTVRSEITLVSEEAAFVVVSLGGHNIQCALRGYLDHAEYERTHRAIFEAFENRSIFAVMRVVGRHFDERAFTPKDMFLDTLRKFLSEITAESLEPLQGLGMQIYEQNYELMDHLREMQAPLPSGFLASAEAALNARLRSLLENFRFKQDITRAGQLIAEARRWGVKLEIEPLKELLLTRLDALFDVVEKTESWRAAERIVELLEKIREQHVEIPIAPLQNRFHRLAGNVLRIGRSAAPENGKKVKGLLQRLTRLGVTLGFHQDALTRIKI